MVFCSEIKLRFHEYQHFKVEIFFFFKVEIHFLRGSQMSHYSVRSSKVERDAYFLYGVFGVLRSSLKI